MPHVVSPTPVSPVVIPLPGFVGDGSQSLESPVPPLDHRGDRSWARERWRETLPLSQRTPMRASSRDVPREAGRESRHELAHRSHPAEPSPSRLNRILIISPNVEVQETLRVVYERDGREVLSAAQPTGIVEMIARAEVELVLCDLALPEGAGGPLLTAIRAAHPTLTVAGVRHSGTDVLEGSSDEALRSSRIPLLRFPLEPAEAIARVEQAERSLGRPSGTAGRADAAADHGEPALADGPTEFRGMTGSTPVMRDVFRMIARVGRTDVTVLVTGESGTGKELVARALHEESSRRHRPFVALNCSALPSELVESELFGHTRGAFTGAVKDRGGLFEAAHGGTLFLDEIGDLGAMAQAKVLRALENGEVMRVGGTRSTRVDVRVIAATNRPLDVMVADGRFREDLLYRLKVISLALPPLRDRMEDLPLLATRFLQLFASRHELPLRAVSEAAWVVLRQHQWPGNVRELRNVMEGALVMCDGPEIDVCDLPASVTRRRHDAAGMVLPEVVTAPGITLPFVEARERALREFDRAYLRAALARHDGNIARTARALGLHRQSLQKLMARRDLRPEGRGMVADL